VPESGATGCLWARDSTQKEDKLIPSDLVKEAESFARRNHEGQTRKGVAQEPYITHVEEVANLVREFGGTDIAIAAAWLHDVVEDCDPTIDDISERFGTAVAEVVLEVTDNKDLPKSARKRFQIESANRKSPEACLIKWADKTSNLLSIANSPPDWTNERKREYISWATSVTANLPLRPESAIAEFNQAKARAEASVTQ
jgi:(p)ppGpp synthase/HD superfamily hydrolase